MPMPRFLEHLTWSRLTLAAVALGCLIYLFINLISTKMRDPLPAASTQPRNGLSAREPLTPIKTWPSPDQVASNPSRESVPSSECVLRVISREGAPLAGARLLEAKFGMRQALLGVSNDVGH